VTSPEVTYNSTTTSVTAHFDSEGNRVYPCRCGAVHGGLYGAYDYDHHNCFHDAGLVSLNELYPDEFGEEPHLICCSCGKSFSMAKLGGDGNKELRATQRATPPKEGAGS
jgi:hypothetical protein